MPKCQKGIDSFQMPRPKCQKGIDSFQMPRPNGSLGFLSDTDIVFSSLVCCDTLKCLADLLLKINTTSIWEFSATGIRISARDTSSFARNEIWAVVQTSAVCKSDVVVEIDTSDIFSLCKQLRKRDMVRLYLTDKHCIGILMEQSAYTKNASAQVRIADRNSDRPSLLCTEEVLIKSAVFQRMIREYKSTCKRINISGNGSFCLFEADNENSLNRTDRLQTLFLLPFFFPFSLVYGYDVLQIRLFIRPVITVK